MRYDISKATASSAIAQASVGDAIFLHRLLREKPFLQQREGLSPAERRHIAHRSQQLKQHYIMNDKKKKNP